MAHALDCFDQESRLEHFLSDTDGRFKSVMLENGKITIHVSWVWSSEEKMSLQSDVQDAFPELVEVNIRISDNNDRLWDSDKKRRHLERDIAREVKWLIDAGDLNVNDIDHVRLRFRMWSRLLRAIGINSQSLILKVSTDPDKTTEVYERLKSITGKHGIPLRVRGTRLDQAAQDEKLIEAEAHKV